MAAGSALPVGMVMKMGMVVVGSIIVDGLERVAWLVDAVDWASKVAWLMDDALYRLAESVTWLVDDGMTAAGVLLGACAS